ncbi:tyrosine protein kinase [Streptococcus azizii]|uniref:Tyrosine-protein kinase CpsD n=1 Tax=Streptococcus azizii TaxID=1579424 RepID=A0AB36JRE7_9STRE|nr:MULTISPECIES: polysaccharide biosynthesis tyrosine autokinase [Streptococcus]MBF0775500.1 polysaccharide biosynthesis tyrosine autokinase [Streptococcus sp. 19428wD3_AN2]ONK28374.1 tyrosine protein kinase [Streptococcus azizii]ONK28999.1 tyrosine protein kinase [Streptococcus azizii]ONK30175.1 tyrosine protein kinase [Streptococcus azizii]TFU84659.1 polysaccharide biosynthesis tyrosine autokinase [Streptococcus sp. AN2]
MPFLTISRKKLEGFKKAEEYYNALRINIQLSGADMKTIVITSVEPNEGKSMTSSYLALSFAKAGYRTLLLDADIRNSVMTGTFKARGKITGLTEYLVGAADLSQGLCDTDMEQLSVIVAGTTSPNPAALLQSDRFTQLMGILRQHYDYIIVDTAPVGVVVDAIVVTQQCDASILVTSAGNVRQKTLAKAKEQLEQTHKPFLGVVLNKYQPQSAQYGMYGVYGKYGKI